jgi:hypothetical protein
MKKYVHVMLIALVVLAVGAGVYNGRYSPKATAAVTADQFWTAVVAGDKAALATMLGPEADFTPTQVIADHQGLQYFAGRTHVMEALRPNQTGAELLVLASFYRTDGVPTGRTLALKRVGGRWVVVRAGMGFSF